MKRQARGCPGDAAPDPRGPLPGPPRRRGRRHALSPPPGQSGRPCPSPPARRQPRRVARQELYRQACSARKRGKSFAPRAPRRAMALTGHEIGRVLACRHVKLRVATGWNCATTGALPGTREKCFVGNSPDESGVPHVSTYQRLHVYTHAPGTEGRAGKHTLAIDLAVVARPRYGACTTVLDTATHSASSSIAPAGAATPACRFVPVHPRLCREPAAQASSPPTAPACAYKKSDCAQCESRASPPAHAAWVRYHEELVGPSLR